jgi:RNA polymerase sigma factor (sigma-70 family)
MDKECADSLIVGFTAKLFGFALSKTGGIDEAEELAARITLEVYSAFLGNSEIANIDGYVWRIAKNVYAKYITERRGNFTLSLDEAIFTSGEDFTREIERGETYSLLRREITYLSKIQREIILLYYYDRLKQAEIAEQLGIPIGTVKWHLFDAKKSLKEGITMKREPKKLGIKPIKLYNLGHGGSPGTLGDTSYFLAKRLTQNIVYAAYWESKSVNEIAEELGVSPLFIEDEVTTLEEYGFMDRLPGEKYRTNIYISESKSSAREDEVHEIYNKYAKIVCEKYVPKIIEYLKNRDNSDIYIPGNDFNLLLWSVIPLAMGYKLPADESNSHKFSVKRPDGGDYIAFASVETDCETWGRLSYKPELYYACGDMTRGSAKKYKQFSWQLDTYYDNRTGAWQDNKEEDYDWLYEFYTGKLEKTDANLEKFKRLYDKGYLDSEDKVNLIVIRDDGEDTAWSNDFARSFPGLTEELRIIGTEFDREIYEINRSNYPAHMQELCRELSKNQLSNNPTRTRVLEQLVKNGVLTLPAENRKPGLCTIMISDTTPIAGT